MNEREPDIVTPGGGQVDSLMVGQSMLVFYKFSKEEEGEGKGGEWYRGTWSLITHTCTHL